MTEKSISEFMEDLTPQDAEKAEDSTTLTLWVPRGYKDKYKTIQRETKGLLGKKLKELTMAAIDIAEAKVHGTDPAV